MREGSRYTAPEVESRRSRSPLASSRLMVRGSWWSRACGFVAVTSFAVHLGAAVYEAAVVAPLWSLAPPDSVAAWAALRPHPDSATLFQPLVAVIAVAAAMAWLSGLTARGWRLAWLTLELISAGALAAITVLLVIPAERELFGAAALDDSNAAATVAWTGEWMRAAAFRFAALLVGSWSAYRAQLAGMIGDRRARAFANDEADEDEFVIGTGREAGRGGRRAREFSFGDEPEEETSLAGEAASARKRWLSSLPGRRRTAKK